MLSTIESINNAVNTIVLGVSSGDDFALSGNGLYLLADLINPDSQSRVLKTAKAQEIIVKKKQSFDGSMNFPKLSQRPAGTVVPERSPGRRRCDQG
ncbi:MAG: hypothetical protein ACLTTO_02755 [Lachnospiraceae bacterium]